MKKTILLFTILTLITGCGKRKNEVLNCTFENKQDNSEFITEVKAEIKENKVINAEATMKYNDKNLAKNMCDILKVAEDSKDNLKCDDYNIYIKNYHKSISQNEISKDEFLEYMDNQNFVCK